MHFGATFSQTEIDTDPTVIGDCAREAGRSPETIGIEGRVLYGLYGMDDPVQWVETASQWRDLEAAHISFNSLHAGLAGPSTHIDGMRRFIDHGRG